MATDGRNLEGDQPRQSIRASEKTPHIIRLWPVTLLELESETAEHKFAIRSRDEQHYQVVYITGELSPELYAGIANIGAQWLLQSIANRIHSVARRRRQPRE